MKYTLYDIRGVWITYRRSFSQTFGSLNVELTLFPLLSVS